MVKSFCRPISPGKRKDDTKKEKVNKKSKIYIENNMDFEG